MEKNRIHPQKFGNRIRMTYAREKEVLGMPNLLDVQKDSYKWFIDEGLREVFEDINPITDFSGNLSLELCQAKISNSALSQSYSSARRGLILTPGPMVELMEMLRRY